MIKQLYKFTIPKTVEVEETSDTTEGKLVKKIKKEVEQPYFIARPNREEIEEGEVFYTALLHQLCDEYKIKPEILLRKRFGNEKGIFTNDERKEYLNLYSKLGNNLAKIEELEKKKELTEEEKKAVADLYKDNKAVQEEITAYENAERSVFDDSAEAIARKRTFFWWFLKLVHEDTEEAKPLFTGTTHEERKKSYDVIEEITEKEDDESKFYSKLLERSSFLVALFFNYKIVKPADFAKLVELADEGWKKEKNN